jgi:hypothetical protein
MELMQGMAVMVLMVQRMTERITHIMPTPVPMAVRQEITKEPVEV